MNGLVFTNRPSSTLRTDLDGHHPISHEQLRLFKENGYVKLKHVLRPQTIEYFGREIAEQMHRSNTLHLPMAPRITSGMTSVQVLNLWTQSEVAREFTLSRKLARLAAELMAVSGVRLYHDQALYKEAGGGVTPWEADQSRWPVSSDRTVTVWIPLQATPLEMGPLAFARGTHRMTLGRERDFSAESETQVQNLLRDAQAQIDETPFDLGEVSFHLGWTFHRTGANQSGRPRKAMTMIYLDEDMRLIEPKTMAHESDRAAWCPDVMVGEVISSPLNPVVWSSRR